jgi:beta-glucanase (GH16 family)
MGFFLCKSPPAGGARRFWSRVELARPVDTSNARTCADSSLPGQRLSACTCPGEDHPGPNVNVGRSAPEVDIVEAQIDVSRSPWTGVVSQSLQLAPFDDYYLIPDNSSRSVTIGNPRYTRANGWVGGEFQQAASHLTDIERDSYRMTGGGFTQWGFELHAEPENRENGYITWVGGGREAWTLRNSAIGPNPRVDVGQRLIPEEPMAMVSQRV